jgi:hypothetical protein
MHKDYLLLKRATLSRPSGQWNDDDFDVLANGVVVGRRLFGRSLRRRGRLAGRGLAGGSFADRFDTARRRFDHGIHGFGCARP